MLELAAELLPLLRSATAVAAVTVARVARSAPRGAGATMAVTADGRVLGSISGGCVEGDAVVLAHSARVGGAPLTARLGFSDDAAHAAGLACGGSVDVVAYRVTPDAAVIAALEAAAAGRGATVGIVLGGASAGRVLDEVALRAAVAKAAAVLDQDALHAAVAEPPAPSDNTLRAAGSNATARDGRGSAGAAAAAAAAAGRTPSRPGVPLAELDALIAHRETAVLPAAVEGADVLVLSHAPMPRLLIVGAGEHAAALCRVATAAGFAVSVCDVWETLVTPERFPGAVSLIAGLPDEYLAAIDQDALDGRSAVCVLTHDERLDVPALAAALRLPVGFVGAMGARGTVTRRAELLRERGIAESDIARIHSPLGLDLGGATPDETAISVLAEIVAARHGGSALPLRERTGPLHRRAPVSGTAADTSSASAPRVACGIALPTGAP